MADKIESLEQFWAAAERIDPEGWARSKAAQEEMAALRKDAERYRWLCSNNFDKSGVTQVHCWLQTWEPHSQTGEPTEWTQRIRGGALDRVIDEAIAASAAVGAA